VPLPAVSEPFLAWSVSGEAEFQEREGNQPWVTHHIKKGSFFLTSGGAPYECRWKAVGPEPLQSMAVFIELSLLQRAMEEVFGDDAPHAQLRDISAFTDATLDAWMEQVNAGVASPESEPVVIARHRGGHRHPSGAQLCRDGQRIAQRQSVAARLQGATTDRLDGCTSGGWI
jgi:hypothetical protein